MSGSAEGRPRRLVICCDGTWNSADRGEGASNVVRMARIVKSSTTDGIAQIVWYHPGVGTGDPVDHMLGGAIGVGLAPGVRAAYAFIANNYLAGDEIFLFGFSRGAYTARSVAGLIGAVGLLHEREMGRFMQAWDWFKLGEAQRDPRDLDKSFPLRTPDVPIRCIGVWDTVGALGVPRNRWIKNWHPCAEAYRFYDTRLGSHVKYAFQALAIDEQREPYQPVPWNQMHAPHPDQDIRQVWFAGVHSDIGGGYEMHGTSDIPFIWMAAQVSILLELDIIALAEERDTREAYGSGMLHNTCTGFWKWAGAEPRTVGLGANQFVHRTAVARCGEADYPRNPAFDFKALPVWEPDAFEQTYAWSRALWPPDAPTLQGLPLSRCEKVMRWLEGS
jgi:uncharacterized protein (DUF2235 family)